MEITFFQTKTTPPPPMYIRPEKCYELCNSESVRATCTVEHIFFVPKSSAAITSVSVAEGDIQSGHAFQLDRHTTPGHVVILAGLLLSSDDVWIY